ncbi:hypothetical protein MRS76_02745 [Rhizobiaceae bacterium n13]|uniref:Cell envelope biogenesis protein OmpA n=1 Tax=Ferirhizobium litorale TaxID=2927786 RepID=A0AAE3U071_9HYPH|nr:hypothetical protein [Fererhizobium litorale]MDI7860863.1 hypothetical protein [Fererhizobium litorale]MDI7921011.1 hypothetical protein [Fererhizobium litorale]
MFETAFTLNLTQFARSLSLPERLQKTPFRNMSLEILRQRNTALDAFFYDIRNITADEAFYISDSLAAEGSIMIVPPTGKGQLVLCEEIDEFLMRGGRDVHVLAVAGMGGSALGAAAFARNVADAAGAPVAAVISGYGLADAMTEPLGCSFLFGWLSNLRHPLELLDELSGQPNFGIGRSVDPEAGYSSRDTRTVLALLGNSKLSFELVVGHSKGSSVLAEAFETLAEEDPARLKQLAKTAKVVTFGARIAMPKPVKDVTDVMGRWDWYGEINSRADIACDRDIPDAGHHTNTEIPGHLAVTRLLQEILAEKPLPAMPKEAAGTSKNGTILKMPEAAPGAGEPQDVASEHEPAKARTSEPDTESASPEAAGAEPAVEAASPVSAGVSEDPVTEAAPLPEPPAPKTNVVQPEPPAVAASPKVAVREPAVAEPVPKPRGKPQIKLSSTKKQDVAATPPEEAPQPSEPTSATKEGPPPRTTH